jgi:hypothetical protein
MGTLDSSDRMLSHRSSANKISSGVLNRAISGISLRHIICLLACFVSQPVSPSPHYPSRHGVQPPLSCATSHRARLEKAHPKKRLWQRRTTGSLPQPVTNLNSRTVGEQGSGGREWDADEHGCTARGFLAALTEPAEKPKSRVESRMGRPIRGLDTPQRTLQLPLTGEDHHACPGPECPSCRAEIGGEWRPETQGGRGRNSA